MGNKWGNSGNSVRLYFWGSKITADGDCSHEIKRCLLLGRKVMTNLDSMLKSRDITLPTKVHLVKAMVFPVVTGCESWTMRKAECQRIDAFELWCWRRLLRVHWTARRSNQSILKVISPGISLEGMMLKLKLQYFGHLMWKVDSLEKTLILGGTGGRRRRGRQDEMVNSGSWWWTARPGVLRFMGSQRVRYNWATELNWIELNWKGEIDNNTIIEGDSNTPLTSLDRSSRHKVNKETAALNETLNQIDLIDLHRAVHPNTAKYIFFSTAHRIFSRIDHMLGHKSQ